MTKHTVTFQILTDDKCMLEDKISQYLWELIGKHTQPVEDSLVIDGICTAPCCYEPPEEPDGPCEDDYEDPYHARGLSRDDFI